MDHLVYLEFQEKWEREGFLVLEDFLDFQVHPAFLELKEIREPKETKVPQVLQDPQDKRGARDP